MVFRESNARMDKKLFQMTLMPDFTMAQQVVDYATGLLTVTWYAYMNGLMIMSAMEQSSVSSPGDAGLRVHLPAGK